MDVALGSTTAPRVRPGATLLVPVGSTVHHGDRLPLDTDTELAVAAAEAAATLLRRRRLNVVVAPAVSYGACSTDPAAPGDVSLSPSLLRAVLVDLARSARSWTDHVLFVNGNHGNGDAVTGAVGELAADGCLAAALDIDDETEAGAVDRTSLMLHVKPWKVRADRARGPRATTSRAGSGPSSVLRPSKDHGLELFDLIAHRVATTALRLRDAAAPRPGR